MLDEENGFYYKWNKAIDLTPKEVELLSFFMEHKDKLVPYQAITRHLYGNDSESSVANMRQLICRINKKLRGEIMILARTSVGYRMIYMGI